MHQQISTLHPELRRVLVGQLRDIYTIIVKPRGRRGTLAGRWPGLVYAFALAPARWIYLLKPPAIRTFVYSSLPIIKELMRWGFQVWIEREDPGARAISRRCIEAFDQKSETVVFALQGILLVGDRMKQDGSGFVEVVVGRRGRMANLSLSSARAAATSSALGKFHYPSDLEKAEFPQI
ncbi:hypothetical protein PHLCEN_2v9674 [Hermanssonia centrifuga]|uniref:Uncharacterized protein n=1 Tax=Hermanssonia centrifuga TaxID=98765 RepID=A0A2R6NQ63_9APHY|nr:hypothetical protein PHLCEN_2v9674 [Hermanssonia centrifuga]